MLRLQGAHPYSGHPSSWWRPGLGQIPSQATWLGPGAFYNAPPAAYYAAPSGRPLMTPEITSPEPAHQARTFHCYVRNGEYKVASFAARDAMKAAGWEETNYANCAGSGVPMAQPVGTSYGGALLGQAQPCPSSILTTLAIAGVIGAAVYFLVTKKK